MKPVDQVTACVVDYGSFIALAEKLSETCKRVLYYSPYEEEYRNVQDCVIGDGLENVERSDEILSPKTLDSIDLFVFPDIGYGGLQRHLRSVGKAVWGSMGASDLELYRTRFLKTIGELGLPVAPSTKIVGVTALREHLKTVQDKWVKVNRFRENMETWHHLDYDHSKPYLDALVIEFGGVADHVVFVVQDAIDSVAEVGYDGYTVDGEFPARSFQGYEKKNELYLGCWRENEDLPKPVRRVNEAFSPLLKQYGYRNFIASEIRCTDGEDYFIDPTMRLAGQTMEHQLESCSNIADIIWLGANGELVDPEFTHQFAAEATLHYTGGSEDWKALKVPESVIKWSKFYHYCIVDGVHWFPPHKSDEVGVLIGLGDTAEEAIDDLKDHLEDYGDCPVSAKMEGFVDLLKDIESAEKQGIEFTDQPMPEPAEVVA